uniref:Mitochondrial ATP5e short variant n=1 Tax=Mesenchytraeus cf. gelidus SL-2017 TaxID=2052679 RepID=A0A2L1DEZ9_9ANNE|nr:mitochondrial ATP5e short variant [Mesenchytraeus cf. gelidus SL-2017]
MSSWRLAGLNYINYSRICARAVRRSLKPEVRVDAMKRDEGFIRPIYWKDGKAAVKEKA